ncbi:MAG TPA: DUF4870 domain-containing protein [Steroidobacteraceae bacterium]|nr:DUF4870 domain-containing protein [Steroidobacteraceae bacterium]
MSDPSDPSATEAPAAAPTENERTWGMLAHLSALTGVVVWLLGCIIGPLVVWLARRDSSAFVAEHAREALNFNITVVLAALVCMALMLVFVGFILGTALFVVWLVFTLIAAIKASEGEHYRYPFSLRLVK